MCFRGIERVQRGRLFGPGPPLSMSDLRGVPGILAVDMGDMIVVELQSERIDD